VEVVGRAVHRPQLLLLGMAGTGLVEDATPEPGVPEGYQSSHHQWRPMEAMEVRDRGVMEGMEVRDRGVRMEDKVEHTVGAILQVKRVDPAPLFMACFSWRAFHGMADTRWSAFLGVADTHWRL
jgi:hypothetical protein